jgi:hypothetical protein
MEKLQFANERLQRFIVASKPRPISYLFKGVLLEIGAWLVIPLAGIAWFLFINLIALFARGLMADRQARPFVLVLYPLLSFILLILFLLKLISVVRSIRRRGRRYRVDNRRRLAWDRRAPILYLRSFYDDYEDNLYRRDQRTPEELLTYALQDAGPIITVGKPNEELPLLGAARVYLKDDDWQASVKYLMTISQLVIIHADVSEGLLWELSAAKENVPPRRLLISFLALERQDKETRQKLYESFKKRADIVFKGCLPESINDAVFLLFDTEWNPIPIKLKTWAKLVFFGRTIGAIRETLRPHLRRRGVNLGIRPNLIYVINILLIAYYIYITIAALQQSPFDTAVRIAVVIVMVPTSLVYILVLNAPLRAASYLIHRIWLRYRPVQEIL